LQWSEFVLQYGEKFRWSHFGGQHFGDEPRNEEKNMNWDMIGAVCSLATVLVAVVTYMIDFHRRKKLETLKELDALWELYQPLKGKKINENYEEYVAYMRKVEHFATAVDEKVYNKRVVKKRASIFFTSQYQRFMKDIIAQRRKQFGRDDYYNSIEKMVLSFKEDRVKKS
jgi:hypothetical protein